ncbi:recombination protein RecR [Candidatus Uhrbacteria bacterium]|nr:recombination protein RecR [Candidatus Uhrbacteria bacterium]
MIPRNIQNVAAEFDGLPGIGPRAALRFAYWLAAQPKERLKRFAQALLGLSEGISRCRICGNWSEGETCSICADTSRDRTVLCVVATPQDLNVVEGSGSHTGLYHVLGDLLDPIEGRTPETIRLKELFVRIGEQGAGIKEIILAFDPDVRGDTTALYIARQLAGTNVAITRLARGLPTGAQLEYADGATVAEALENRRKTG